MSSDNSSSQSTFEQTMEELEKLVTEMENGDIPLEQALAKFERGIRLAKNSQEMLKRAEQRVQVLVNQDGEQQLEALERQQDQE